MSGKAKTVGKNPVQESQPDNKPKSQQESRPVPPTPQHKTIYDLVYTLEHSIKRTSDFLGIVLLSSLIFIPIYNFAFTDDTFFGKLGETIASIIGLFVVASIIAVFIDRRSVKNIRRHFRHAFPKDTHQWDSSIRILKQMEDTSNKAAKKLLDAISDIDGLELGPTGEKSAEASLSAIHKTIETGDQETNTTVAPTSPPPAPTTDSLVSSDLNNKKERYIPLEIFPLQESEDPPGAPETT